MQRRQMKRRKRKEDDVSDEKKEKNEEFNSQTRKESDDKSPFQRIHCRFFLEMEKIFYSNKKRRGKGQLKMLAASAYGIGGNFLRTTGVRAIGFQGIADRTGLSLYAIGAAALFFLDDFKFPGEGNIVPSGPGDWPARPTQPSGGRASELLTFERVFSVPDMKNALAVIKMFDIEFNNDINDHFLIVVAVACSLLLELVMSRNRADRGLLGRKLRRLLSVLNQTQQQVVRARVVEELAKNTELEFEDAVRVFRNSELLGRFAENILPRNTRNYSAADNALEGTFQVRPTQDFNLLVDFSVPQTPTSDVPPLVDQEVLEAYEAQRRFLLEEEEKIIQEQRNYSYVYEAQRRNIASMKETISRIEAAQAELDEYVMNVQQSWLRAQEDLID